MEVLALSWPEPPVRSTVVWLEGKETRVRLVVDPQVACYQMPVFVCAWVFHISCATLLKPLEYSWEGMMSRWRVYLQMLIWTDTDQLAFVSVHRLWCLFFAFRKVFYLPSFLSAPAGTATSGNGEFGDWSAFNQGSPCPSASAGDLFSGTAQPAVELFSGSQPAVGQPPAASSPTDLFDLMGPSQATMTASQSMNFSMMSSSAVGISLPLSRSQVRCCCTVLKWLGPAWRKRARNAFLASPCNRESWHWAVLLVSVWHALL